MRTLALAVLAAALSACGLLDPRPDPSRFFVLASLEDRGTNVEPCALPASMRDGPIGEEPLREGTTRERTPREGRVRVGLGPVELPDYLRQPQLWTRTSAIELARSKSARWAEPLETMLPRVLADDLAQLLGLARVELYPWYSTDRPDWQIEVAIVRFEPDERGDVLLIARWRVRETAGATLVVGEESRIERRAAGPDPAQRAEALSSALGALAEEIARATCARASASRAVGARATSK